MRCIDAGGADEAWPASLTYDDTDSLPAAADSARKGRYAPLASLVPALGARRLLALQPGLAAASLAALRDNGLCSSVVLLLDALWADLRKGAASDDAWRAEWVPTLLGALCGGPESLRSNACTYVLPAMLRQDPASLGLLLRRLLAQQTDDAVRRGAGAGVVGAACAFESHSLSCLREEERRASSFYLMAICQVLRGARCVLLRWRRRRGRASPSCGLRGSCSCWISWRTWRARRG